MHEKEGPHQKQSSCRRIKLKKERRKKIATFFERGFKRSTMPLAFGLAFILLPCTLLLQVPLLHAVLIPDPAPIDLHPATSAATIPAFPEQSDVSSAACPLDLPTDLFPSVKAACSSSGSLHLPSRSRCCPALATWLYAAYSPTALAATPLPDAGYDLPALPEDSEACAAGAERALRARGLELPHAVNGTCNAAYCYCGVRLRRLACAGGFEADASKGLWVPAGDLGRRMELDCSQTGLGGCSRCLRSLNQVKAISNGRERAASGRHSRECQLMGLTWLLWKNRTLYLPSATTVLRVLMAADDVGSSDPDSCSPSQKAMPLAVGSDQIDSHEVSYAISRAWTPVLSYVTLLTLLL